MNFPLGALAHLRLARSYALQGEALKSVLRTVNSSPSGKTPTPTSHPEGSQGWHTLDVSALRDREGFMTQVRPKRRRVLPGRMVADADKVVFFGTNGKVETTALIRSCKRGWRKACGVLLPRRSETKAQPNSHTFRKGNALGSCISTTADRPTLIVPQDRPSNGFVRDDSSTSAPGLSV
jgi:hypothetical protein